MDERRIALKFAYDGLLFFGFQRQPQVTTVEGSLVQALQKVGVIKSPRECGYRSSSRTDRGVSALGNIVSVRSSFPVKEICSAVNSEMEGIWSYSAIEVPEDFNPRAAKERWYRFYLSRAEQNPQLLKELASRYVGIHDFSSHAKKDKRNPMRRIDSIELQESGFFFIIDFRGESFLWNMIRRIVWMLNEGSSGRIPLDSVGPEPKRRPTRLGLARPEFLILMDIDVGIDFPIDEKAGRAISIALNRRIADSSMKLEMAQELQLRVAGHQNSYETLL